MEEPNNSIIFCRVTGFTSDFLSFIVVEHLVLSWSPSTIGNFCGCLLGTLIGSCQVILIDCTVAADYILGMDGYLDFLLNANM